MTDIFNPEAETAVLNVLLLNPDKVYDLLNLKAEMFGSIPNQIIYQTILELAGQGFVPEYNLVVNHLQANNKINSIGLDYLVYLRGQNFARENLKVFEDQIINNFKAKTLISILATIPEKVTANNVGNYLSVIRNSLDNLIESSGGDNTQDFNDVLKASWDKLVEKVKNPGVIGSVTGFRDVDMFTGGIVAGDQWVIAGRPSMGKSAIMLNMALSQGKKGISTLIFSLEMNKQSLAERLLSIETGISGTDIRMGLLDQIQLDLISDAIKRIKSYPIYIDTNFVPSIEYIITTARKYKRLKDINVIHLDHLHLLCGNGDEDKTRKELGQASRLTKLLAEEIKVGFVLYAQLNRGVESRPDKRPLLSDLRETGEIEQNADLVNMLYREDYYDKATRNKNLLEYIIRKQRNGPVGTIMLQFDPNTTSIKDI